MDKEIERWIEIYRQRKVDRQLDKQRDRQRKKDRDRDRKYRQRDT